MITPPPFTATHLRGLPAIAMTTSVVASMFRWGVLQRVSAAQIIVVLVNLSIRKWVRRVVVVDGCCRHVIYLSGLSCRSSLFVDRLKLPFDYIVSGFKLFDVRFFEHLKHRAAFRVNDIRHKNLGHLSLARFD